MEDFVYPCSLCSRFSKDTISLEQFYGFIIKITWNIRNKMFSKCVWGILFSKSICWQRIWSCMLIETKLSESKVGLFPRSGRWLQAQLLLDFAHWRPSRKCSEAFCAWKICPLSPIQKNILSHIQFTSEMDTWKHALCVFLFGVSFTYINWLFMTVLDIM